MVKVFSVLWVTNILTVAEKYRQDVLVWISTLIIIVAFLIGLWGWGKYSAEQQNNSINPKRCLFAGFIRKILNIQLLGNFTIYKYEQNEPQYETKWIKY